jgi:asparagine synthase (glutamine-hydrolysing)
MSGIYGFALSSSIRKPEHLLAKMRDALPAWDSTPQSQWVGNEDQVGLGVIHPRRVSIVSQFAGDQARGVCCIFEGIIHSKSDISGDGSTHSTGAELMLKEYLKTDERCIENFSGNFNVAWWDEQKGRLVVANDKLGQRSLFYAQKNRSFALALIWPELSRMICHPKKLIWKPSST